MGRKQIGNQTIKFMERPFIRGNGNVVGKKEGEGPLKEYFDKTLDDDMFGEKSWEKGETKMLKEAMDKAVKRGGLERKDVDVILSGDLLNQLMSSSFMARDMALPFLGLYGACSTMAESLIMGSVLIDGGFAQNVLAGASSHFCTAERQFRLPVEHGNQRPPSAQWTATAAGAILLSAGRPAAGLRPAVRAEAATIGKVIDAGVKDANQMGAAMAPAAVDTILNHLQDTGRDIDYYDLIVSGDLGFIGRDIVKDLLVGAGYNRRIVNERYDDCGTMIYSQDQKVGSGGSGCGCSAAVFTGYLMNQMEKGEIKKLLFMSTGAMLSTISPMQGESIPAIAHAISLEVEER